MERRITIEEAAVYREDYQMRMLGANEIEGLLPVRGRGMDGNSCYDYDVSGKLAIRALYEKSEIGSEDLKVFLAALRDVIENIKNYLLNIHCVLLSPDYIFYEDSRFYFCYYPLKSTQLWEDVHELTEYFVKRADYTDQECVRMVFLLHKETMSENYSLDKIIDECLRKKETESGQRDSPEIKAEIPKEEVRYDAQRPGRAAEQEMGSFIMEDAENFWAPMKKFLKKHKKPRWGEWDGLHIEEEEL
ncbi:hypothetical protein IMSAGC015_00602 [Lachnospiraceae bacterium]|nr:hypothetical protein IMSAGC015_00602 [Lachnospiraceae bacterium]